MDRRHPCLACPLHRLLMLLRKPMPLRYLGYQMQLRQREISIWRVPIWKTTLRKKLIYKLCTFWWRLRHGAVLLGG